MHPNLVGPPSFQRAGQQTCGRIGFSLGSPGRFGFSKPFEELPMGHGFAAPFDREGTARRRVPLIEDGVARGVLYDRTYASRARAHSTGSALIPGGSGTPIGPSALHMDGGDPTNSR